MYFLSQLWPYYIIEILGSQGFLESIEILFHVLATSGDYVGIRCQATSGVQSLDLIRSGYENRDKSECVRITDKDTAILRNVVDFCSVWMPLVHQKSSVYFSTVVYHDGGVYSGCPFM